jgi:hypothetical protein
MTLFANAQNDDSLAREEARRATILGNQQGEETLVQQAASWGSKSPIPPEETCVKSPPEAIKESEPMRRFLTATAVSLMLGLAPAYAETQAPATETSPVLPSALPAASDQVAPATTQSSQAPNASASDQSAAVTVEGSPFLAKQEANDFLIGNLIGETVVTPGNEAIGEITDLITDRGGKVIAVLIGAGGFLGIDQKDVAIRFEDIKVTRDANNDLTVTANVTKEMIARAPDYQTLDDQQIIMGEKSDREDSSQ